MLNHVLNFMQVPYVPSSQEKVEMMASIASVKPDEKSLDLGSGDGRVVIAMAKRGAEAYGYEISINLVNLARENIKIAGLEGKAFIEEKDYWQEDLSSFDIVTIYGMTSVMERLEGKLQNELKPNSRVISNVFSFPNWPHTIKVGDIYVYQKY